MRYLCLIYLDERELASLPDREVNSLNSRHVELNEDLRRTGHFVEAEALEPAHAATCVRVRQGRTTVTDGPFIETKEQVAGFYLIEARDLNEAIRIATRLPSAPMATVEVRPIRTLMVDGKPANAT